MTTMPAGQATSLPRAVNEAQAWLPSQPRLVQRAEHGGLPSWPLSQRLSTSEPHLPSSTRCSGTAPATAVGNHEGVERPTAFLPVPRHRPASRGILLSLYNTVTKQYDSLPSSLPRRPQCAKLNFSLDLKRAFGDLDSSPPCIPMQLQSQARASHLECKPLQPGVRLLHTLPPLYARALSLAPVPPFSNSMPAPAPAGIPAQL